MFVKLQEEDFSEEAEKRLCIGERTGIGGISVFTGVVRDHARGRKIIRMELSAYGPMAQKEMERLREEALEKFGIENMTIVHRVGMLEVGRNIVCMAACAAHREEAFKAVMWGMNELKARVPIWKKEFTEDGGFWVDSL